MIGLGIDTGGTCTDAVIYDLDTKEILASAKALTTREDLKLGIRNVFEKLPPGLLHSCETLSLSTTLATNACVENRGGKGRLVFIGLERQTLENSWQKYGYDRLEDIYLLECRLTPSSASISDAAWETFREDMREFARDCDCVSIVQLFAREHHGAQEKKAAGIIKELFDIPVILGHSLFPDRDILQRGTGALLNARLIPLIQEFLEAMKQVLSDYHLDLPLLIMRSDGNLMSGKYTCLHPVETLLCGPAASVMGARHLTDVPGAVVVDMGGTTTDVSIIRDGVPLFTEGGIQIEKWKTFVKGLYVDTFALGGDTAVRFEQSLFLDTCRILPLCSLASRFPEVLKQLQELDRYEKGHPMPVHEFFLLLKELPEPAAYTEMERKICQTLKEGPLSLENLGRALGRDIYALKTERLEQEGIILRSGLTPTDIMHIRGDFSEYCREASVRAASFVARSLGLTVDEICDRVYDLVEKRLYCNLVRILLQVEHHFFQKDEPGAQMAALIKKSYELAKAKEKPLFSFAFTSELPLIGIGAPVHIFLEPVARMLGTKALIPGHAAVANAVGAIVGNLSSSVTAQIYPDPEYPDRFQTITPADTQRFTDYEEALDYAREQTKLLSREFLLEKGGKEPFSFTFRQERKDAPAAEGTIFLSTSVTATATGKSV